MITDRKSIFTALCSKMEDVGFKLIGEQKPHRQKRKESEFKFVHPLLEKQFLSDGYKVLGSMFYIKPLSDEPGCEIGLVSGTTSPLLKVSSFPKTNAVDTYKSYPAWVNREGDDTLDQLLKSIESYIDDGDYESEFLYEEPDQWEGVKKQVIVNKYERSRIARDKCVEHHGLECKICGLNFKEFYGDLGAGFIHVHHIKPLSIIDKNYRVDYKVDLIPVCPNCHAMLHHKINGKLLTVAALKKKVDKIKPRLK